MEDGRVDIKSYWDPRVEIQWNAEESQITEEFLSLFLDAVKSRLVADVPVGIFLSGGIDSSAVTAFAALSSTERVKTFTVGFTDETDERPFAKAVAEQYGTEHTELVVSEKIEDVVPKVIGHLDEPFGDSSVIPTYLVAREARKHLKVVLTGDGGDELFAGYPSYIDQRYQIGGTPAEVYWGTSELRKAA